MRCSWISCLVLGCSIAIAGAATADDCDTGCGAQQAGCVAAVRGDRAACRAMCRHANHGTRLNACIRTCVSASRKARVSCGTDHLGCVRSCTPPDTCRPDCAHALGTCTRDVVGAAKRCFDSCRGASTHGECPRACTATLKTGLTG